MRGEKHVTPARSVCFRKAEIMPKNINTMTLMFARLFLSPQSEAFALTFYPHLLFPPVAAGYAAILRRDCSGKYIRRYTRQQDTPGQKRIHKHGIFL